MTNLEAVDAGEADATEIAEAHEDLERLVNRLRHLSPAAWRSRRGPVSDFLVQLAQRGADVRAWPVAAAPGLPDHALADAVAVLGTDLLDDLGAACSVGAVKELRGLVRNCLEATR